ncbi:enoyl-CoA hydratase-related protein [Sphingomonas sp. MMS24-JH45]
MIAWGAQPDRGVQGADIGLGPRRAAEERGGKLLKTDLRAMFRRRPMKEEAFTLSVEDGIATITLDRPERMNALTRADAMALVAAFDRTDADDAVRAVIVTGSGRAFCAGADLSAGGFGEAGEGDADEGEAPRDWAAS